MSPTTAQQALDALKYHQEQTRPIQRTIDAIAALEADMALVPVTAARKDAVFQASIDFISQLTGMTPPPIEIAPAETFQPFKVFADKVCEIFTGPPEPPDLLAALRATLNPNNGAIGHLAFGIEAQARAAIQKATGAA